MRLVRERILTGLTAKGWTQERLELEAKFGQGYLTRILKGNQQRILPRTLKRIEDALDMPRGSLAGSPLERGLEGGALSAFPPALGELTGYADVELQVGRLEPNIPVEVFRAARQARLTAAPDPITVAFLRGFVCFMAVHCRERAPRREDQGVQNARRARPEYPLGARGDSSGNKRSGRKTTKSSKTRSRYGSEAKRRR